MKSIITMDNSEDTQRYTVEINMACSLHPPAEIETEAAAAAFFPSLFFFFLSSWSNEKMRQYLTWFVWIMTI